MEANINKEIEKIEKNQEIFKIIDKSNEIKSASRLLIEEQNSKNLEFRKTVEILKWVLDSPSEYDNIYRDFQPKKQKAKIPDMLGLTSEMLSAQQIQQANQIAINALTNASNNTSNELRCVGKKVICPSCESKKVSLMFEEE